MYSNNGHYHELRKCISDVIEYYQYYYIIKYYQCPEYHSQGLVFHCYRVISEEDSDTKLRYLYRSYKLD